MFWTDRINKLAGALLLLSTVLAVLSVLFSFTGDANPFDRGEVEEFVTDIRDNEATLIIGLVFDIASSIVGLAVAAALYLVFRGRNRVLALFAFAGLFASDVAQMAVNGGHETLIILADDFESGGAGQLAAGDDVILEVARAVAIYTSVVEAIAATALGFGLISLGAIIGWAPMGAGTANPPRWIGWVGVVSGLAFILTWLGVLAEGFFALFIIAGLGFLIASVALGVWLLRQPDEAPAT